MHQYLWISSGAYLRKMTNEEKYKQQINEFVVCGSSYQN